MILKSFLSPGKKEIKHDIHQGKRCIEIDTQFLKYGGGLYTCILTLTVTVYD